MGEVEFQVAWAKGSDLEPILKVNEFFSNEYSHSEAFFKEGITSGRVLIARNGDRVVGYLIYEILWGNTPFLALLKIAPDFQGKGVGKKLLSTLEGKLRKDGYRALISSSEAVNQAGNEFHIKSGFQNIGTLEMIFGKEVFYKKEL